MNNRILKPAFFAVLFVFVSLGAAIVVAQDVDVTFTKWLTELPNMEGVVGGAVGTGTFAGEVLNFVPGDDVTNIEALYHFNGESHSFTAHVFVTENAATQTAEITGVVTDGWLQDRQVRGNYTVISCPDQTNGVCYQGSLLLTSEAVAEPEASREDQVMTILQINYTFDGTRAEQTALVTPMAEPISTVPGLIWKVWLMNEADNEAGGIYLFESREAAEAFVTSEAVAAFAANPAISDIDAKMFEAVADLSEITRGPLSLPEPA